MCAWFTGGRDGGQAVRLDLPGKLVPARGRKYVYNNKHLMTNDRTCKRPFEKRSVPH